MASLDDFTWDKENEAYYMRHKLSNGQYCMIALTRWIQGRNTYYSAAFAVANKKKNLNGWFDCSENNNIELKSTGHCGLEALRWCRDRLFDFEREVHRSKSCETKIVVTGTDNRRFRVYERYLSRHGYKKACPHGEWVLVKTLDRKEDCDA